MLWCLKVQEESFQSELKQLQQHGSVTEKKSRLIDLAPFLEDKWKLIFAHRGGRVVGGFWDKVVTKVVKPLKDVTHDFKAWWEYGSMKVKDARLCEGTVQEHCVKYDTIVDELDLYLYSNGESGAPPFQLNINKIDEAMAKYSSFEPSKKLVIITHGFTSSYKITWVQRATNALLGQNANVITTQYGSKADYILLANNNGLIPLAEAVGRHIGALIDQLITKGWNGSQIHLVGHSLGGHISGIAGKYVKAKNVSLGRITALDPVGRVFDLLEPERRLSFDDADFTDCIFTDAGHIGQRFPTCAANYYANCYGKTQPFQTRSRLFASPVAHSKVSELFVESLHSNHVFQAKKCDGGIPCKDVTPDRCVDLNGTIKMGYPASPEYKGFFFTKTNGEYPYAKIVHGEPAKLEDLDKSPTSKSEGTNEGFCA
ncbi:hypothetical protein GE061_013912 [Apolygus lucorum]|uniref:Lipase domain-containing protein n=1 Tax=Apolygus lucorum TaxID=248454 RepID=A0A8S9XR66_APOLU|nr:hypothetical protein GE061_013912 [Apolygus lucorum]